MTKRHLCEITTLQLYDVVEIIYEMGVEILPSRACHNLECPAPPSSKIVVTSFSGLF